MKRTLQEAWRGYQARRLTAWIAIGVTALLLGIFGGALTVGVGLYLFLQQVRKDFVIDVYLKAGTPPKAVTALTHDLERLGGVSQVEYIDRQRATQDFLERYPQYQRFFQFFTDVPFPHHFRVYLKPSWRNSVFLSYLRDVIASFPGVDDVYAGGAWITRLERFTLGLAVVSGCVLLVVFFALSIVVSQTIRLTVVARHEVVHLLLLLGAPLWMVRRPFELLGTVYGMVGGCLAAGGNLALMKVVNTYLVPLPYEIQTGLLGGLVLFALMMGWVSARSTLDDLLQHELPV